MYENKTVEAIHDDMLNDISVEFDKTKGSFFFDSTRPPAIEINKVYVELDKTVNKLSIDNLKGDELAQRIYERTGIIRKPSTKATTTVTIMGSIGANIILGDKVASDTVNFVFTENKTIGVNGQIIVSVECEQFGIIGNLPIGAIKYFPVTLAGLNSVINTQVVSNGFDAESDADLLKRYYDHIRSPVTSGNKAYFRNLINEITGVGDCRIIPLANGDLTFAAILIDSNKLPASLELVTTVQNLLDPNMDGLGDGLIGFGVYCTVTAATGLNVNVSFTLIRDSAYTLEQVTANVNASITEYLKSIAFISSQVSYAQIGNKILDSQGVLDYSGLTINGGVSNIAIASNNVAILGTLTIL